MIWDWKVTITHQGLGHSYYNTTFPSLSVTGKENDVSCAVLVAAETTDKLYPEFVGKFDGIKVYVKAGYESSYTEIFDGTIRDITQQITSQGEFLTLKCKGLGEALEETHLSTNYGYTSQNDGIDTIEEIIEDLLDNYVEDSYDSGNVTGYTITDTYVDTIDAGLSIPFLNAPYQSAKSVIDLCCQLDTAYRNGATAGPHYFVDVSGNLRIKTIGTQQADGGSGGGTWGTYCGGNEDTVSLYHGRDFLTYDLNVPTDMYANNVLVYATLRKPAYDYWTEDSGGSALWDSNGLTSFADSAAEYVVGSHSIALETDGANNGYAYYPSGQDANWDVTAWGTKNDPPRLNFYFQKDSNIAEATTYVRLFTTGYNTHYYQAKFCNWHSDPDDEWVHASLPFGPYAENANQDVVRWDVNGTTPSWSNIDGICFHTVLAGGDAMLYIDDLHFTGKIAREAVDTSEVTTYKERQHVLISKTALDDSGITSDDTGMAGAIAYAELLRRVNVPRNINFDIELRPDLKPGEYFKIYAGKSSTGYNINGVDFRVLTYTHKITAQGAITTVNVTDDVLNSFPLNKIDQRAVLNEYLLENNEKATDMKGVDVDLLVSHMRKEY